MRFFWNSIPPECNHDVIYSVASSPVEKQKKKSGPSTAAEHRCFTAVSARDLALLRQPRRDCGRNCIRMNSSSNSDRQDHFATPNFHLGPRSLFLIGCATSAGSAGPPLPYLQSLVQHRHTGRAHACVATPPLLQRISDAILTCRYARSYSPLILLVPLCLRRQLLRLGQQHRGEVWHHVTSSGSRSRP